MSIPRHTDLDPKRRHKTPGKEISQKAGAAHRAGKG